VDRKWYAENREDYIASRMVRQKKFALDLDIWKRAQGCSCCGRHDGWLEHHHIDPASKRIEIAMMYSYSLKSLYDEIAKCVVLCRSCHLFRHADMRAAV
jgi:hypothetical protein